MRFDVGESESEEVDVERGLDGGGEKIQRHRPEARGAGADEERRETETRKKQKKERRRPTCRLESGREYRALRGRTAQSACCLFSGAAHDSRAASLSQRARSPS